MIELPLTNPELFTRVGIKPPKGVLLYGPPGTGKTLLARAMASNIEASFLKVVSSAIVDKYIGESARIIREMFGKITTLLQSFFLRHWKELTPKVMQENTNLVLFSWMKLMLSEANDSLKELLLIERSKEHSWR